MDIYKDLAALRCFTHSDMLRITGSESAAQWQIKNYLKKGYIERVRRDLYAVISLETDQPIPSRFQIASRASDDACVSHHSAFEFYGYAMESPDDTASLMAENLELGKRTVEKALTRLQELGMIEWIGSKRDGRWIVIKYVLFHVNGQSWITYFAIL